MNWRSHLQRHPIPLVVTLISLLAALTASLATEPTNAPYNQFLLKYPTPHLTWATWKIVQAKEKAVLSPLKAKLVVMVENGVTKSVVVNQSTGFEAADLEVAHWILTKWHFRPSILAPFTGL